MTDFDIIHSPLHEPAFDEIGMTISGPASALWKDLNKYLQEQWRAKPAIAYSRCSGKPGWNVKYQRAGKSLCTLYPENEGFVALVVITLAMVPEVMAQEREFTPQVVGLVASGRPYNGTLWLMIQVTGADVLEDVKRLLELKQAAK